MRAREDGSVRCECWATDHWGSACQEDCPDCHGTGYVAEEDAWGRTLKQFNARHRAALGRRDA